MPRSRLVLNALAMVLGLLTLISTAWVAKTQLRHMDMVKEQQLGLKHSVVFVAFGLERHFLEFRRELAVALPRAAQKGEALDSSSLALSYEILVSRVNLVKESSSLEPLRQAVNIKSVERSLDRLVDLGDELMKAPSLAAGQRLLGHLDAIASPVQDFTRQSVTFSTRVVEEQLALAESQARLIAWLCGLQLLIAGTLGFLGWRAQRASVCARNRLVGLTTELQASKAAAEAASQSKTRFLANMSHELRTPFQGVVGMLQLLDRTPVTEEQRDLIATAHESAQHLLALLNDVLDMSAVEAGRLKVNFAAVNLPRLCSEVHEQMLGNARGRNLAFTLQLDPRMPQWVCADGTRLKQILFNLVGNAIKFTPRGQVALQVISEPLGGRAHSLQFRVIDTGVGMDSATIQRLFQRFETGNTSLTRPVGGTGLGLEISRTLARLMGGDITVNSELGKGSCFELQLDLREVDEPEFASQGPNTGPEVRLPSLRILIADDHPINRKYMGMVLRTLGHRPVLCADGQAAVDAARQAAFDVAILDVHMPVMDGFSATRALRAMPPPCGSLPILMLTADVMEDTRLQALDAGASDIVAKPVQIGQLSRVLAQLAAVPDRLTSTYWHELDAEPAPAVAERTLASGFGDLRGALNDGQVHELLALFFSDGAGAVAALDRALESADPMECKEAAHTLAGVAAVLGFQRVTRVVGAVQLSLEVDTLSMEAQALREQLGIAIRLTRKELEARGVFRGAEVPSDSGEPATS